ncbi:MAG: MarR family winged helix-turn-helix transcriptional regulator [Nocardioides sp.]
MNATPERTDWLDDDQQRAWRALVVGTTLLFDRLDDDLQKTYGLSIAEYEIMVRLSESPDRRLRMSHLAFSIAHSRSRVTHTIARMQKSGLVERVNAPEDGRGVFAQLTDEGFALLERAAHLHVTGVRESLVDLASPDDLEAMGRVLNAVADNLVSRHPEMDVRQAAR